MYTEVRGTLPPALSPFEPHWMNVPLYVMARGLTTSPMPIGWRTLEARFDFIDNALLIESSDGGLERRPPGGAGAAFYADVMRAPRRRRVGVKLSPPPQAG